MKELLYKRIANLLAVKSLVTLTLTLAFFLLLGLGNPLPPEFTTIYTTVIGFYFGTQATKERNETK